jgi:hypothetical protein
MIHLEWNGPIPIAEAFDYNGPRDYGLYAIYGTHAILGPEVLLYVGQSAVRVHLGRIGDWDLASDKQWSRLIDQAEAFDDLLHKPSVQRPSNQKHGHK